MLDKLHTQPGMNNEEILKNIIGYSTLIETPFGQKCALYADHTATGRPFKMIEDMVQQKIKPMVANSHTETSLMGYFSTQMLHYAEISILKSFKVSKATHFSVPTGNGATGAFERLTKILRVEEISKMEQFSNPHLDKTKNPNIPAVYISPYEHHSNILPWQNAGCNLQKVSGDKYGNMNLENLQQKLMDNSHFKVQIVSVSATSNVTSQRTNLDMVNQIIKNYKEKHLVPGHKIFFIVDAAAFCSHNRLDLSEDGFSEIDFVCISPHKHLGGSEATGVLISKLSAYDSTLPPSFPGGGTVKAVFGLNSDQTWYDSDPTAREMPGTPNAIGFYRAALTFELQDYIGLDYILEKEEQNAKYFYNRIQQINEEFRRSEQVPPRNVFIYGDTDIEIRYDVFSFNIYGPGSFTDSKGKSLFHPNFVARVLNDVFGIQVRSGCSCAGPYGVLLLGIPEKTAFEIVDDLLQGYEDVKPGWIRLDTFFSFEQYELDYIIEAIRLIAKYGEKIQRFYEPNSKTGQFSLKTSSHPVFDFSLFGLQTEDIKEIALEERRKYLADQLEIGAKLLENPTNYMAENHPHLLESIKQLSENHSEGSRSQLDQSRSSGLSGKSIKASRTISKQNPDSQSLKSQTKIPSKAYPQILKTLPSNEEIKQSNKSNESIKNLITNSIRDELRNVFAEHPGLNSYSQRAEPIQRQGDLEKKNILKRIFEKYSNAEAGVMGVSQVSALQFAQDYTLLNSNKLSINDLIMTFNQLNQKKSNSNNLESTTQLSFAQFSSFIENIAMKLYQNNPNFATITNKIDAFYAEYLQKSNQNYSVKAQSKPINWSDAQIPYMMDNQKQSRNLEQLDNFNNNTLTKNTPMPLNSSRSNKILLKSKDQQNDSIFYNNSNSIVQQYQQNPKQYFYADSFSNKKNNQQAISKKDIILKRAEEIKKSQNEHEKSLYTFISK